MFKKLVLSAAIAVIAGSYFSTPAVAGHCPRDVKKINAASGNLDGKNLAMAKEAAATGLALHKAGKHGEALKGMHAAMKTLGIKH